jgi:hypothetical protein
MLKAPMFFIVFLGSRTGADRSERAAVAAIDTLNQVGMESCPRSGALISRSAAGRSIVL